MTRKVSVKREPGNFEADCQVCTVSLSEGGHNLPDWNSVKRAIRKHAKETGHEEYFWSEMNTVSLEL